MSYSVRDIRECNVDAKQMKYNVDVQCRKLFFNKKIGVVVNCIRSHEFRHGLLITISTETRPQTSLQNHVSGSCADYNHRI